MAPEQVRSTIQKGDRNDDPIDPPDARIEKLERQVEALTRQIANLNSVTMRSPAQYGDAYHESEEDFRLRPSNFSTHRELHGMRRKNYNSRINCSSYFYEDSLELPQYRGSATGEDFLDWLDEVERICKERFEPDDRKVGLVAMKLKGVESAWWKYVTLARKKNGESRISSWEEKKEQMRDNFSSVADYNRILFGSLQELKQGEKSVADYTEEFYSLVIKLNLPEPEELLVRRYVKGFRDEFQRMLYCVRTISEAYKIALALEIQAKMDVAEHGCRVESARANQEKEGRASATRSAARGSHVRNSQREQDKWWGKTDYCYKCNEELPVNYCL